MFNLRIKRSSKLQTRKKRKSLIAAQVTLEFTLCFIVLLLMLYGIMMAFRWAGVSLAERRIDHDRTLRSYISPGEEGDWRWSEGYSRGPLKQINPDFADPVAMNLVLE